MAELPADPDKYHEAVKAIRRRIPMTDPEFRALEDREKRKAFWVAGVATGKLVQEVKDVLSRAVDEGRTLDEVKADIGGRLAEAWGGEDPVRLETVFRTNIMGAYNSARTEVFSDPDIQEARPYLRFDAVGDNRTSEICEQLDGTVLPADDPFWNTHTPPMHHNCRSVVVPLTEEEAEAEGVGKPPGGAPPGEDGFGTPASPEEWEPDLSGFDPDVRSAVKEKLND